MGATFFHYLFADYSGAAEHSHNSSGIELIHGQAEGAWKQDTRRFSRDKLHQTISGHLESRDPAIDRTAFGFDHQFSWPEEMWNIAGISGQWRSRLHQLVSGDPETQRPALDIPRRFCRSFNSWVGSDVFSSPTKSEAYGIPRSGPKQHLRLTESTSVGFPTGGQPKPANVVGGQGAGAVGGQTLCGLYFLEQLASAQDLKVAFWPFDGIDLDGPEYEGRHVGFEIYPDGVRPRGLPKSDLNDALSAALWMAEMDRRGDLASVLTASMPEDQLSRVLVEGWIAGAGLGPEYALAGPRSISVPKKVNTLSRPAAPPTKRREISSELRTGRTETTRSGYINRNQQRCLGTHGQPGNHPNQIAYKMECLVCGHIYGANGADVFLRRCPHHDSGALGINF
ncbi:MAG: hypothetical protein K8J08_05105, partial [Thermoanaerobaculia bacterium]|nr:hypothetical protein [Thermoanaerobaculia bacterium]